MIDPKYIIYHDLIGFHVFSRPKPKKKNENFLDICIVIDETRDMLITEKEGVRKKYIKENYVFRFKLSSFHENNDQLLEVHGENIIGLPVNRLRSLKKKRWFKR